MNPAILFFAGLVSAAAGFAIPGAGEIPPMTGIKPDQTCTGAGIKFEDLPAKFDAKSHCLQTMGRGKLCIGVFGQVMEKTCAEGLAMMGGGDDGGDTDDDGTMTMTGTGTAMKPPMLGVSSRETCKEKTVKDLQMDFDAMGHCKENGETAKICRLGRDKVTIEEKTCAEMKEEMGGDDNTRSPPKPDGKPLMTGVMLDVPCKGMTKDDLKADFDKKAFCGENAEKGKLCISKRDGSIMELTCEDATLLAVASGEEAPEEGSTPEEKQKLDEKLNALKEKLGTAQMAGVTADESCSDLEADDLKKGFRGKDFCEALPEGKVCFLNPKGEIMEKPCEMRAMGLEAGQTCEGKTPEDFIKQTEEFSARDFCTKMADGVICRETPEGIKELSCEEAKAKLEEEAAKRPKGKPKPKYLGIKADETCTDVKEEDLLESFDPKEYCVTVTDGKVCTAGKKEDAPLKEWSCEKAVDAVTKAEAKAKKAAKKAAKAASKPPKYFFEKPSADVTCASLLKDVNSLDVITQKEAMALCNDDATTMAYACMINKKMLKGGEEGMTPKEKFAAFVAKAMIDGEDFARAFKEDKTQVPCRKLGGGRKA